ncbi:dTDP-4-dehydrorhamnose 3,5-epimerase [Clostridium intestinale]|uniref:dTDP-4-dehydrorhamnose 3,5-epimerase n=2 Tax=Clostridium intestinale TaxID=36845 RepID=A0A7D6ZKE2_9CLOT|nr:dTDP-4-dehydrorhamnose 3,5-epimerase [Clostridium intestinale]
MEVIDTEIDGVCIIENSAFSDDRGSFTKIFHEDIFKNLGLNTELRESYYSISKKGVIRGMHFQLPPYDHDKLVHVAKGKINDVILDLRKDSKTFLKYISIELSDKNRYSVYIPKGCAHGFNTLEEDSIVIYNVSTVYNKDADWGVRWDSFGMNWNNTNPVISQRDSSFETVEEYIKKI